MSVDPIPEPGPKRLLRQRARASGAVGRAARGTRTSPAPDEDDPHRVAGGELAEPAELILVLPDQLSLEIGPAARARPGRSRIVLVESDEWLSRRPYHRQRIGTILLAQRAFAIEAREAGLEVTILRGRAPMVALLRAHLAAGPAAVAMEPAEREARAELATLVHERSLRFVPHEGFLAAPSDLDAAATREGWRMDRFYQHMRRRTGILMSGGAPVGGRFSFDAENRRPWRGEPVPPEPPRFERCALRAEVEAEIATRFSRHPGVLDLTTVPARRDEVERFWQWVKAAVLPTFGPYEDAMSVRHRGLFHSRLSPVMNLHRILPRRVVEEAAALPLPLESKEGFIRQILGWREFVALVHRRTDGFRIGAGADAQPLSRPGDGGYANWAGRSWEPAAPPPAEVDGGARPNALGAVEGVPATYWGVPSGLACLDAVVADVWEEGWSHHITRLMVLSNLATLAGIRPRDLCDWFWIAYVDAWDWVVEPNVLAMSTYGFTGMTTKPYVSGSAYLGRMGDYCANCRFRPEADCPIGGSYWDFLRRHDAILGDNPRMKLACASSRRRSASMASGDRAAFVALRDLLVRGRPNSVPAAGLFDREDRP